MMSQQSSISNIRFKLNKAEKICSQVQIDYLFKNSSSIFEFPIKLNWCLIDASNKFWLDVEGSANPPIMCIFATSKKFFKRAVKRNKSKRILRECYRLNNHNLKNSLITRDKKMMASWSYVCKLEPNYAQMDRSMQIIINKCLKIIENA